jgi:zeaxanthin glucosyltransferase
LSGHREYVDSALVEPLARAANLPFISFGEKEFPEEANAEIVGAMSQLKGEEAMQFGVGALAKVAEVRWRELPKLLAANGIDALVDTYDFYGEVVPMYLGMPFAILSTALHFDYSGYTPLRVYGPLRAFSARFRSVSLFPLRSNLL